jgi:hypothetical protein
MTAAEVIVSVIASAAAARFGSKNKLPSLGWYRAGYLM